MVLFLNVVGAACSFCVVVGDLLLVIATLDLFLARFKNPPDFRAGDIMHL